MINNLQNILTQDHLSTADPVYVVFEKQDIVVDGDYDYDKVICVPEDNRELQMHGDEYLELEEKYYDAVDFGEGKIPYDPILEKEFDPDDYEKLYIKQVDRFVAAFFIRQNAENFIAANKHNFPSAFMYVESAYRNYEWKDMRKFLIDKAEKQLIVNAVQNDLK